MKGKLFIALRLFSNRMDRRYIPIVNWVSSFAIAIGLASILIVISVMNGFEEEIYKKILKSEATLIDYRVESITKGSDATAEIVTIINDGHLMKQGRSVSTDVVQGSVESFLNALNK